LFPGTANKLEVQSVYKVLVSDPISEQGLEKLYQSEQIEVIVKTGLKENELAEIIGDFDALLVRSQTKVTEKVIAAGKKLRVIGRAGVGVDNIDLEAATRHGIIVINAPDGNTISACEHTFAMLMALARKIPQAHLSLIRGEWDRKSFVGVELNKKTLGIVGLGRIGTEVAKRALAFGMSVLAYDPFLTTERAEKLGVKQATVDEICENADFITVHTPLTKETRHIIDAPQFARMKPGVRIVNCARGGIINEQALVDAIRSGKVAGAALDVFEQEPPHGSPLLDLSQVIVTPHLGASTEEAQINVAIDVAEEILNILENRPFKNAVNLPSLPADVMKAVEPYLVLGEKLGKLVSQLATGVPKTLQITYDGGPSLLEVSPITRSILKGVLAYHRGEEVNYVNAPLVAEQIGMDVRETKTAKHKVFTNLVQVTLETETESRSVAGTLFNGLGPRIVQIDNFSVDASPSGTMVITGINIASMQVGRKTIGGEAVMLLSVDKPVPPDTLKQMATVQGILKVKDVQL
jgi:D-3-phosphoglycerate dehydrogenase